MTPLLISVCPIVTAIRNTGSQRLGLRIISTTNTATEKPTMTPVLPNEVTKSSIDSAKSVMCSSPHGATERSTLQQIGVGAHEQARARRARRRRRRSPRARARAAGRSRSSGSKRVSHRKRPRSSSRSSSCATALEARAPTTGRRRGGGAPRCAKSDSQHECRTEQHEGDEHGGSPGDVTSFTGCLPSTGTGETPGVNIREEPTTSDNRVHPVVVTAVVGFLGWLVLAALAIGLGALVTHFVVGHSPGPRRPRRGALVRRAPHRHVELAVEGRFVLRRDGHGVRRDRDRARSCSRSSGRGRSAGSWSSPWRPRVGCT